MRNGFLSCFSRVEHVGLEGPHVVSLLAEDDLGGVVLRGVRRSSSPR